MLLKFGNTGFWGWGLVGCQDVFKGAHKPRFMCSYEHKYINEAKSNSLEAAVFVLLHFQELALKLTSRT